MLLFLDVESIYSKVVPIVDILGKCHSLYDFIDLKFTLETLNNPSKMRDKCALTLVASGRKN